jgi:hypothetical protein
MAIRTSPFPPPARDEFRSALSLPDASLKTIGTWVKEHIKTLITGEIPDGDVKALATEIGVTMPEVGAALSLAMTVLMNVEPSTGGEWNVPSQLGIDDLRNKLSLMLAPVDVPHEELTKIRQNSFAARSIIPTLSDVDVLCDLRAVFRSFPSGSTSEKHRSGVSTLLGFEPVAIVNLELNDASGNDHPAVFQVSEQALRNLIKTLEESLAQIEIVKNEMPRLSPKP